MDDQFRELYQEIILDHNRSPRNFGSLKDATHTLEGHNPLCGDHYVIYLKIKDGRVEDVRFEGKGCAISKSSASVMSEFIKGKKVSEIDQYIELFQKIVRGELDPAEYLEKLGKLAVFAGVSEFPMRVKCATLPWHTLHNALHGKQNDHISTEE
ncbi:Fe-S cluster assembly sulfur transfer protein SufU [Calditrichota bacterium GD2]